MTRSFPVLPSLTSQAAFEVLADESGSVQFSEMQLFLDAVYAVVFALHAEVRDRLALWNPD